jgi:K+-sensing histidine kinase KdpD
VRPRPVDDPYEGTIGFVVGGLGPVVVASALVAIRNDIEHTTAVLILVVVVIVAAIAGGRAAGALGAIMAAVSFDFFLTRPYLSLRIASEADIETTIVLLAIGLLVGEIVVRARRHRSAAHRALEEIERLRRVARLAASGTVGTDELLRAVEEELTDLLGLRQCSFLRDEGVLTLPRLERSGTLSTSRHVLTRNGEFELPPEGVELPVVVSGRTFGRFLLEPSPGAGVRLEARIVAVALADQLAAFLTGTAA